MNIRFKVLNFGNVLASVQRTTADRSWYTAKTLLAAEFEKNLPPDMQESGEAIFEDIINNREQTSYSRDIFDPDDPDDGYINAIRDALVELSNHFGPPIFVFAWVNDTFNKKYTAYRIQDGAFEAVTEDQVSLESKLPPEWIELKSKQARNAAYDREEREAKADSARRRQEREGQAKQQPPPGTGYFGYDHEYERDYGKKQPPPKQPASTKSTVSPDLVALGLTKDATWDDIKKKFRELVFKHHPDRNPGDPTATAKTAELTRAYKNLEQQHVKSSIRESVFEALKRTSVVS